MLGWTPVFQDLEITAAWSLLLLLATGQLCHVRSGSALFREIKYPRDRDKTSRRFDCIMVRCYMVAMNEYYINNKMLTWYIK